MNSSRTTSYRSAAKSTTVLLAICSSLLAADASWHKSQTIACHPLSNEIKNARLINDLSVRGGSESASAWNAGSRYDYRSPKSSVYNRTTPTRQKSYVSAADDTKDVTKEAIANAFLNREDRNRFIGKIIMLCLSVELLEQSLLMHN